MWWYGLIVGHVVSSHARKIVKSWSVFLKQNATMRGALHSLLRSEEHHFTTSKCIWLLGDLLACILSSFSSRRTSPPAD